MNQNSTMNQNATNNLNNGMAMDSTMQMPEKFNYVVRVMQGGQLMTETLESNGTALNAIRQKQWLESIKTGNKWKTKPFKERLFFDQNLCRIHFDCLKNFYSSK